MVEWMRFKFIFFFLSLVVILPGAWALVDGGLRLGLDFTGGTLYEIVLPKAVDKDEVWAVLREKNLPIEQVEDKEGGMRMRFSVLSEEQYRETRAVLSQKFGPFQERRFETVGPTLGRELLDKALVGGFLAVLGIILYVGYRFASLTFGVSAVLALFHDSLVLLCVFALLGKFWGVEIDGLFLTALLTVMSFSVHDTVVVFDRIRELKKREGERSPPQVLANQAVSETLVRSLNNSLTIIFMLLALLLLGGETLKFFVLALLVGTVSGTYSSPFTAVPILVIMEEFAAKRSEIKTKLKAQS